MPFVQIHTSSSIQPDVSELLVRDVRIALVEVLELEETIGQVMLYQTSAQSRSTHHSRDLNFVFIEIIMFPGRDSVIKNKLIEKINTLIQDYTGTNIRDINCCIIEVSMENWSGGISHK